MKQLPARLAWALEALRYHLGRRALYASLHMLRELERTIRREWAWRKKGG